MVTRVIGNGIVLWVSTESKVIVFSGKNAEKRQLKQDLKMRCLKYWVNVGLGHSHPVGDFAVGIRFMKGEGSESNSFWTL